MWVVVPLVILAGVALWMVALLDLIRATDMDPVARVILALALLIAAPIGLLMWLVLRGGRAAVFAVVGLTAVAIAMVVGVAATGGTPGVQRVSAPMQVQVSR